MDLPGDPAMKFTAQLIGPISRQRRRGGALAQRHIWIIAINRRRRRVHHRHRPLEIAGTGGVEHRDRAGQVDPVGAQPVLVAALDRRHRRQIEAADHPRHRAGHRRSIGDIADNHFDPTRQI